MKKSLKVIIISALSLLMLTIVIAVFAVVFEDNGRKSYVDFKRKDYYNFQTIGEYIFNEMDNSKYTVGCEYYIEPYIDVNAEKEAFYLDNDNVNSIIQKYDVVSVYIIDENSIMFNCGSCFQQAGGVIITRNDVEPKDNYENMGFDGDVIDLNKIDEGIYAYKAGL